MQAFWEAGAVYHASRNCWTTDGGMEQVDNPAAFVFASSISNETALSLFDATQRSVTDEFFLGTSSWNDGELYAQYSGMNGGSNSRVIGKLIEKNMFSNEVCDFISL